VAIDPSTLNFSGVLHRLKSSKPGNFAGARCR